VAVGLAQEHPVGPRIFLAAYVCVTLTFCAEFNKPSMNAGDDGL